MDSAELQTKIQNSIWMVKYSPKHFDGIILNESSKGKLKKYIDDGIIPHLFLCSSPGQGKTTLAKVLVDDVFKCDKLYINASKDNNVETVRNKIYNFAQTLPRKGNFKIVILDEADGFGSDQAQRILRVLMDECNDNTRFIICANNKERVMDAIQSRCVPIDMTPPKREIFKRLVGILKKEGVEVTNDHIPVLAEYVNHFYPDIRATISAIQTSIKDGKITDESLKIGKDLIEKLVSIIISGEFLEARKFIIKNEPAFNYDYSFLLDNLYKNIIVRKDIPPCVIASWSITINEHLSKMSQCVDKELNTSACVFKLIQAKENS